MRWWALAIALLAVLLANSATTGANSVGATKAGDSTRSITPNDLKPTQCATPNLTAKISGSGTITGTSAAELITGGAAADSISAAGGNDCLLGGDGNDTLNGGNGTDVCLGGGGTDTFVSCETQIQ